MQKLITTLVIIFVSLSLGYALRRADDLGAVKIGAERLAKARIAMQKLAIYFLVPFSSMLSLWGLPSFDPRLAALPFLGVTAWIAGGMLAVLLSNMMGLGRKQTGSMFCCGMFTNIGAVGSLVCVMFIGEQTIAFTSLYRLCEELVYFAIAYPIARQFSQPGTGRFGLTLKGFKPEPALKVILCALAIGIGLNVAGVARPAFFGTVASASMILGTICFLCSIGLGLRISAIGAYRCQSAAVMLIKFALIPCIIIPLAWLLGLGEIAGGTPLKVAAILSAMPVAMNALIPPSLFGLDLDLANACWIFTHLGLIPLLPVILFLL